MLLRTRNPRIWLLLAVAVVGLAAGVGFAMLRTPEPGDFSGKIVSDLTGTHSGDAPVASAESPPAAGSLESLLPGLEAKVAANPKDADARLLLAQTYGELGRRGDALRVFTKLVTESPNDGRVRFMQAELLMRGDSPAELRAAFDALGASIKIYPAASYLARLHQGEIKLRLGDKPTALRIWREQLQRLAPDDQHRSLFERAIANASATTGS